MFAIIIGTLGFILYGNYLLFYPFKTLVVSEAKVVTKEIHTGDLFVYKVSYCKYTQSPAIVYRTFHKIDESRIETFPAVQTITVTGCNTTDIPLQTYQIMQKGEYYMLVTVVFQLNPLRQEQIVFRTDNFKII